MPDRCGTRDLDNRYARDLRRKLAGGRWREEGVAHTPHTPPVKCSGVWTLLWGEQRCLLLIGPDTVDEGGRVLLAPPLV